LWGRAVALVLLLMWSYAFEFSLWLGLAVLTLFCVAGPLLFASAQRFKLANTSWRGLRFGYDVPRAEVYRVFVPLLLLWTTTSVLQAANAPERVFLACAGLSLLGFPWAHARLKRLQHSHARFGLQRFHFEPNTKGFYGLYAKAFALLIVGGVLAGVVAALGAGAAASKLFQGQAPTPAVIKGLLTGLGVALLLWVMTWPYFAARLQQIVWGQTHWGPVHFEGHMKGFRLWRLVLGNSALVLLTAGLYWPFAAVAVARYRVESISVLSSEPWPEVSAPPLLNNETRAAGDGAADLFGLDIGW
jgi:uncharacterized membrane protein YjgN (DUF898 family)